MINEKITRNEINKEFQERVFFQKTVIELKKEIDLLISLINRKEDKETVISSINFIKKIAQDLIVLLSKIINEHPEDQSKHLNGKKSNSKNQEDILRVKNCLIENINSVFQSSIGGKSGFNHSQEMIEQLKNVIEGVEILDLLYEDKINK